MFSPLDLEIDFKLSDELNGVLLEKINANSKTLKAKIYIPMLMQNISGDKPKKELMKTGSLSMFANTEGRPNITSAVLNHKNYIESSKIGDKDTVNMQESISLVKENVENWLGMPRTLSRNVNLTYSIAKGTSLRCTFLNSKISNLSFKLNSSSDNSTNSIK